MIYDYKCLSCTRPFQVDVPITRKIVKGRHLRVRCPHCKTRKVRKIIHHPNVIFAGGGWGKDKK